MTDGKILSDERKEFERWMINSAKIRIGASDPYPAQLERDYWKVWQAAYAAGRQKLVRTA